MKKYVRPIYSIFKLQIILSLERATFRFSLFVQPLLYTFLLYFIYKDSNTNLSVVVYGSLLLTLWSCLCFSSLSDINREKIMGTFEHIYCSPIKFIWIMVIKTIANTILICTVSSFIILTLCTLLGITLHICNISYFVISVILTVLAFISLSLAFSSLFTLSRNHLIWINMLEYPLYILCGMVVPVSYLPFPMNYLSYLLPPTKTIELFKLSIEMRYFDKFYFIAFLCFIHILIFFAFSKIVLNYSDKKMRVENTGGLV
ncbi:hypothetical protein Aargi30884_17440 [Amedibacterium intestinale]|uniref:ABC-2 type transporter transmembrane domain-containing protein n=1 Tax=Amedibacterium intestinale TaxID=2583452 RepID=A0A6N4TJS8_9FIRM|nr:ABC transporter permease [Amedibacterium intestinale]BBK22841.1 hypothetical protein Aargi30884_17440 [Amedibacterium intestinale]